MGAEYRLAIFFSRETLAFGFGSPFFHGWL
jgi:hypothetical protein